MERLSRRRLIEDSLAALTVTAVGASVSAEPTARRQRTVSPSERLRIAVVGVHGQGRSHVSAYSAMDDVEIVAICDADTACFGPALEIVQKAGKKTPETVQDVRRLLDRKDIDCISSATPNHWHALVAIWAMQAGKDVYIEKPASHNVLEGRRMVEAARKYGRICQVGTQSRSNKGMRDAIAYIHKGGIGKVYLARGLCYKRRDSIGKVTAPTAVPATVDYNLWLGPAPEKPVMRQRFHYDWHWQWDYGNGDIGNQGVHEMDKARWGLNKRSLPKSALGIGGRFGYVDDGETPNTELTFLEYDDAWIVFEVRGLPTNDLRGARVGNIWYGTEGIVVSNSYSSAVAYDLLGNQKVKFDGGGNHHRNFIEAVRSRKVRDLNCDVEEGHLSAALCHLGNISFRLGTDEPFSGKSAKLGGGNAEVWETFGRFEDHLAANGIKLESATYRLGRRLSIDARSERFVGDEEANRMLTRQYRTPFVVPDRV
ncbi:MAG: Gfo/Idh/MocA family oxidoreductase [Chthonomonadales bacterium]|nr:Gfo/Idh/MocA family oxidoreductase [Chthonomonadales bacterium]